MATTFGITAAGFVLKRLADILPDITGPLLTIIDPLTGETLTPNLADENDPLVNTVNSLADALSALWEQEQLAYNQFDPQKAIGAGLSGLVQLNGISRFGRSAFDGAMHDDRDSEYVNICWTTSRQK